MRSNEYHILEICSPLYFFKQGQKYRAPPLVSLIRSVNQSAIQSINLSNILE